MKKLFSMLVIFTMLLGMIGVPAVSAVGEPAKDYFFEEHFDGYTNGADGKIDVSGLYSASDTTKKWYDIGKAGAKFVADSASGDNYITASNTTSSAMDAYLTAPFYKGNPGSLSTFYVKENFAVDIAWKRNSNATGSAKLEMMFGTSTNVKAEIGTSSGLNDLHFTSGATAKDASARISSDADANGFIHARLTFSKAEPNTGGQYNVVVRNINDGTEDDNISLIEAKVENNYKQSGVEKHEFTGMKFGGYEKASDASSWSISEFSAYKVDAFTVDSRSSSADGATYDVVMSDNLNENQSATVTVKVDNADTVCAVSGNTIKIPLSELAAGNHTVSLEGVLSDDDVYCYDSFTFEKGAEAPKPVFTMDISEYSASRQVVKNGVDGSADGINVSKLIRGLSDERTGPEVKTDYTDTGKEIKYLSFADKGNTNRNNASGSEEFKGYLGSVYFSKELTQGLIGNGDEMTIEFWSKNYQSDVTDGHPFTYGFANNAEVTFEQTGKTILKATPEKGTDKKYNSYDLAKSGWHYGAISRKWTPNPSYVEGGAEPEGTWTVAVVVDGVPIDISSGTLSSSRNAVADAIITIGGSILANSTKTYNPYDGAIAEFNVYNKYIDAGDLKNNFDAQKAKYSGNILAETVVFKDGTGTQISNIAAGVTSVTADVVTEAADAVAVMALYDNENNLKDVTMGNTLNLSSYTLAEGWKIKCIVFGMSSLKPVFTTETITLGFAND